MPGQARRGQVHLVAQILGAVVRLGDPLGAEGVGLDDVGPGLEILSMDRLHRVGQDQREDVGVALQRNRMVHQALATIVLFFQAQTLDHGAHGPIQDQDAAAERVFQRGRYGGQGGVHGLLSCFEIARSDQDVDTSGVERPGRPGSPTQGWRQQGSHPLPGDLLASGKQSTPRSGFPHTGFGGAVGLPRTLPNAGAHLGPAPPDPQPRRSALPAPWR